eukprot:m.144431 g.144431  ORF g.144431 m.144431 type:complete len:273 (+) comp14922_c0_seq1:58-876(+)
MNSVTLLITVTTCLTLLLIMPRLWSSDDVSKMAGDCSPSSSHSWIKTWILTQDEIYNDNLGFLVMESLVMEVWNLASQRGLIAIGLDGYKQKSIPPSGMSPHGFLMSLNSGRKKKRKPLKSTEKVGLNKPFNKSSFHFGKVDKGEILFKLQVEGPKGFRIPKSSFLCTQRSYSKDSHYVLINRYPLGPYSGLLTPYLYEFRNQRLTIDALMIGISFAKGLSHIRVGFNSLGAGASVNHLHFQFWSIGQGDEALPCETASRVAIIGVVRHWHT